MEKEYRQYLITNFLQGKLSKGEERELLRWVRESEANKEVFLREQSQIEAELGQKTDFASSVAWTEFKGKIMPQKAQLRSRWLQRSFAPIAAAFVLGLIIASVGISLVFSGGEMYSQLQHITTPYGARTNFELPDGSKVWLNAGSTISFPSKFDKNRSVDLRGEAFFDVKKGRPFVVSTESGTIEVKGTSFNVKSYENDLLETTLVSGIVHFAPKGSADRIVMKPGTQVRSLDNNVSVLEVETELFTSWKEGRLVFRNEYLPSVAKTLERWYNIRIELDDDPVLSKIWFTGNIEMESFTEVMDLIKITSSIDYSYDEKTRTVHVTKHQK